MIINSFLFAQASTLWSNLIAYYTGDNTANDALGTYNGTLTNGATYATGKINNGFSFDGINDYVSIGDVMDVGLNSWSYSMWFNASQLTSEVYYVLFSKSIAGPAIGRVWATMRGNKIEFNFDIGSSGIVIIQSTQTFTINTWYNITCVLDRNDKLKLYIDGILENVIVTSLVNDLLPYTGVNYNNAAPFRIGAYTSSDYVTPNSFFNGKIDEFSVWNRAITAAEVTELYNTGIGKQYPL